MTPMHFAGEMRPERPTKRPQTAPTLAPKPKAPRGRRWYDDSLVAAALLALPFLLGGPAVYAMAAIVIACICDTAENEHRRQL